MKKSCRKCAPKPNNPKQLLHVRNSVENKIFWNRIIKKFQKSYIILLLFLTQFLLMEKTNKNKKGLELVTRHSSSYKTNSGKFLYQLHIIWPVLMMKYKVVFELSQKLHLQIYASSQWANSWHHKLFHIYLSFWIWKVRKGRKTFQKFEYLENEKSFYNEMNNFFYNFTSFKFDL